MVRLYLLGFTHDLKGVVFSQRKSGKTGTFWVPIDESFLGAVDKLQRARTERDRGKKAPPKAGSKDVVGLKDLPPAARTRALPPVGRSVARSGLPASEIQQLLREGKSIKTVAAAAKTELAWVERLAEPVIAERLGVVRLAQRAYMVRPRLGSSGLQLGEAVQRNLEERRATIDGLDDAWDARSGASGSWRVWIRFSYRGKRRSAEWEFRKGSRSILPRNRLAAELGWWAPERADEPEQPTGAEGEGEDGTQPAPEQPKPRRKTAKRRRAPARRPKSKAKATSKAKRAPVRKRKPAKRGSRRPAPRRRR
jgi:hypothetical protein